MAKASIGPSPIRRVPVPDQKRRSSMALPTFDATSTAASGNSDYSYFGEPGPSRPGTRLFTPGLPTGRTVRQSDPFDLDRPEVLGFGSVFGRREVRGSVTRQPSRGKRVSTVAIGAVPAMAPFLRGILPLEDDLDGLMLRSTNDEETQKVAQGAT
jgi:hypothetical protein